VGREPRKTGSTLSGAGLRKNSGQNSKQVSLKKTGGFRLKLRDI
jgi:hypothetical protein